MLLKYRDLAYYTNKIRTIINLAIIAGNMNYNIKLRLTKYTAGFLI